MSWADRIEELRFPQIKVVETCSAWGAQHAIDKWEELGYALDSLSSSIGTLEPSRVTILFRRQRHPRLGGVLSPDHHARRP
jgi:hypothetical protein